MGKMCKNDAEIVQRKIDSRMSAEFLLFFFYYGSLQK